MESCVRRFHVYKDIWIPATGEVLSCKGEDGNIMDPYTIAKLVFESHDVELMAKVKKLLQSAPPIYVQLEQPASKRKLESLYKAKAEPVKKKERKDDSQAVDLNNNGVSQSTVAVARDAAKEIPWVKPPCRRFVYKNTPSCCKMLGCTRSTTLCGIFPYSCPLLRRIRIAFPVLMCSFNISL